MTAPRRFGLLTCLGAAAAARAQCDWLPGSPLPGTNGRVYALFPLPGGELVVGGDFYIAGSAIANSIALWNGAAFSPMGTGLYGPVRALALTQNGDVVAADGTRAVRRWNGATWSPIGVMDGTVYALLTMANGDIVVGGSFRTAGGVPAAAVARWNGSTWSAFGAGPIPGYPFVRALAVMDDGDLLAAGDSIAGPNLRTGFVARWHGGSWTRIGGDLIGTFPNPPYSYGFGTVYALLPRPDGAILAGGGFAHSGGVPMRNLASWDGARWSEVGGGTDGPVSTLRLAELGVLVCGGFTSAGPVAARWAATWTGNTWVALGTGPDTQGVLAAAVLPGGAVVTGGYTYEGGAGGIPYNALARWDGSRWSPLIPGTNGLIDALAVLPSGDLVAAGRFSMIEGVPADRLARWNGVTWSPLGGPAPDSFVWQVQGMPNGDVVAGGEFTTIGGVNASRVARWDGGAWSPLGSGMSGGTGYGTYVSSFAVLPGGDLVAGGNFDSAGGVAARNIAAWDGASWRALGAGIPGDIGAMAVLTSGDLVVGGTFSSPANRIARWDGTGWWPLASGIGASSAAGGVYDLALLPSGDLVAAGWFQSAGGAPADNVARWNGAAWSVLGTGMPRPAAALAVLPDGDIVAASDTDLLRYHENVWAPLAAPTSSRIFDIAALPGGLVAVCGEFILAGDRVNAYLVRAGCCEANCDGSSTAPILNIHDFSCFLNRFVAGDTYANCDASTVAPILNIADFSCFLNRFAAGCP